MNASSGCKHNPIPNPTYGGYSCRKCLDPCDGPGPAPGQKTEPTAVPKPPDENKKAA